MSATCKQSLQVGGEICIAPRAGKVACAPGTMDQPGRNHPGLGRWLIDEYCRRFEPIADPMCGAGQLWSLRDDETGTVYGCDIRFEAVALAQANGITAYHQRAETWIPPVTPCLVAFSPPYPNCDHDSGRSGGQIALRVQKHLTSGQACPGTRNLLPVFLQVATYCGRAPVAVIVRNWIERNREVDWVSEVEQSMRFAGFGQVDRFWRRILPGPTTQWKLKSGKQTAWVDREWILVGRLK